MVIQYLPKLVELRKLKFSFVILLLIMVLFLGGQAVYGELATTMNSILVIYVLMLFGGELRMPKREHEEKDIIPAIFWFLVAFVPTLILMAFITPIFGGVILASTIEAGLTFGLFFGFTHAFVKAYIEEDFFRSRLVVPFGEVGQAILFGAFHFFILYLTFGFTTPLLMAMIWLTGLGFIWGIVENKTGLVGATGSHFAYNLAAFGMLPIVFGSIIV